MPRDVFRRVCFVTGTRAEFGLMRSTLTAIAAHPSLQLQLIVTGMHLDRTRGRGIDAIRADGWKINTIIPWKRGDGSETASTIATGSAIATMAKAFAKLKPDIVLVTGDRVEAFAGATAAHLSGRLVSHVHGGDRALGLVDDSLRHSISKLAHIHFPATRLSAERIAKMGEDRWRIFRVGSPGLDDVRTLAANRKMLAEIFDQLQPRRFAMLILHPQTTNPRVERDSARMILRTTLAAGFERIVIVYPNNDPGSDGIAAAWDRVADDPRLIVERNLPRSLFLGLLRDTAVLVGNSSSGIIEAASFGTPVLDIGTRQSGREHGENVTHVELNERAILRELKRINRGGNPIRFKSHNVYGTGGVSQRIASTLAQIDPAKFRSKLIAY